MEKDIVYRGNYNNIFLKMLTFGPLLITNLKKTPSCCKSCATKLCKTSHTTDTFKSAYFYKRDKLSE